MKKLTLGLMFLFVFLGFSGNANAAPNWDVSGNWVFDYYYGGSNLHDMTLVQAPDGSLSGTGGAFSGVLPYAYPWTVVSGSVDGDAITLTADYDALACTFTLTGTISAGAMSGTWTDDCAGARAGTWETTSGVATAMTDSNTVVVVKPSDMQGWGFLQETATGSGSIVAGPVGGFGDGSVNLIVDGTGGEIIGKAAYLGTELSDITRLEYSTYRSSGGPALAVALQFNFDGDVTDANNAWQGRLVYEPYHTQTVLDDTWQVWDAMDDDAGSGTGNWWFSNVTHATNSGCTMANPCTWAEVLAAFPDGGVHNTLGGVVLKAGGGWTGGFDGNVDALTIGVNWDSTTYNFEPDVDTVVSGGGHINSNDGKGKKTWTFSVDISVYNGQDNTAFGEFTLVNHTTKTTCNYDEISGLSVTGNTATFTAGGSSCADITVTIEDLGEPGAGVDTLAVSPSFAETIITGGNFQVTDL
jgi:hypothetical protein